MKVCECQGDAGCSREREGFELFWAGACLAVDVGDHVAGLDPGVTGWVSRIDVVTSASGCVVGSV
jgi:hypothetical protein